MPRGNIHQIDPEQVRKLAALGCTNDEIADYVGCDRITLWRRKDVYEAMLEGRSQIKVRIRQKQMEALNSGNPTMLIWLGKQYLGQTDKVLNKIEAKSITLEFGETGEPSESDDQLAPGTDEGDT